MIEKIVERVKREKAVIVKAVELGIDDPHQAWACFLDDGKIMCVSLSAEYPDLVIHT